MIYLISQKWFEKYFAEKTIKITPRSNNYEVYKAVARCFPNILTIF
jgi:hypothetical protein